MTHYNNTLKMYSNGQCKVSADEYEKLRHKYVTKRGVKLGQLDLRIKRYHSTLDKEFEKIFEMSLWRATEKLVYKHNEL